MIDSITRSFCLCHCVQTVYLIRARKFDLRCVKGCHASRVDIGYKELIKISCYTEYKALRLSLIYNILNFKISVTSFTGTPHLD